ncbi:serine/threonine protein phosphatase [Cryomorphaceae bacterium]|nr:serine/threonine protein phosphatase [Cryomorphaceae bacterium]
MEKSRLFVIGDVHGCLHTYEALISKHWNPDREILIQVGDLINRGKYSLETVQYCQELELKYPGRVAFMKGNHEWDLLQYLQGSPRLKWLRGGGSKLLKQLYAQPDAYMSFVKWIHALPLSWENDCALVSHAGWALSATDPFKEDSRLSVLNNRRPILNVGKTQVIGHTPQKNGKPKFDKRANCWTIDTGAYLGIGLTGIKVSKKGNVKDVCYLSTDKRDIK